MRRISMPYDKEFTLVLETCIDKQCKKRLFQLMLGSNASVFQQIHSEELYINLPLCDFLLWNASRIAIKKGNALFCQGNHEEEDDNCILPQGALQSEVICYEYHVLYSISYQAPVLYFRASFLDGTPLPLDAIWERAHDSYKPRLLHGPWETITQQEHPILGQPFFVLHPCRTNEFMSSVQGSADREGNYITSWLSTVGPVVGLSLPLSYGKTV
ncbi:ubiquitin-like-conjugating enzyme ATG10 isoform X3 [Rhinoderma darwinii]